MTTDESRVFLSYSRQDSPLAERLVADLTAANVPVWFDRRSIAAGQNWDDSIQNALLSATAVVLVLSPASCQSQNVMDEIAFALSKDKRVIPVMAADCDVPYRWTRIQYIDLRSDYASGIAALIGALAGTAVPLSPTPAAPDVAGTAAHHLKGMTVNRIEADQVVVAQQVGEIKFNNS